MRKSTLVLFFTLVLTPLFNIYAQETIPIRPAYPKANIDLYFYIQFFLTLAFGLGLPIFLAHLRWRRALPKKYGSLTAIAYMFPSIFGVICAVMITGYLRLFDPTVAMAASRVVDSPASMTHLSGVFMGYLALIPLFLISMRIFYFFKKKSWVAAEASSLSVNSL